MGVLDLPESPMAACWRLLRDRLEGDATLAAAGVDVEFREDRDWAKDVTDVPPGRVMVFVSGRMDRWNWHAEHEHAGALVLTLDVAVRSLDFADVANLQTALHRALYEAVDTAAFQVALTDAGAETGQPLVTRPLAPVGREKNNKYVVVNGEIALGVRTSIFGD